MDNNYIHILKIYNNTKGPYFNYNGHRYYLSDLYYDREQDTLYVLNTNCFSVMFYDIDFNNNDSMTFKIKKVVL